MGPGRRGRLRPGDDDKVIAKPDHHQSKAEDIAPESQWPISLDKGRPQQNRQIHQPLPSDPQDSEIGQVSRHKRKDALVQPPGANPMDAIHVTRVANERSALIESLLNP